MIYALVDAAVIIPINAVPLVDDTDSKSIEAGVVYNASGLVLLWNFVTPAGVVTQTAVTPTNTGGVYDWQNKGNGMYAIEIPASGGGTINNNTEGTGYFTGVATGVLPWRGPDVLFTAVGIPSSGTGTGARTVAITVDDGATAVQGARVRLTKSAETYVAVTDVSGGITFNVDDGTWTVAITAPGYSFAGASLVVNGNETQTYSITQIVFTPSGVDQTTGFFIAYDESGDPEVGASIYVSVKQVGGSAGAVYDSTLRTVVSGVDGLVEIPGLFLGVTYEFYRGTSLKRLQVTIPLTAGVTYELPSI